MDCKLSQMQEYWLGQSEVTPEEQPKILLARLPLCDREKGRMMMNIMEERKRRENLDDERVNLLSIPSLF